MSENERLNRVQKAIKVLVSKGIDYRQMSVLLDGSVSTRTLYRWANGTTKPQRDSDVRNIERLSDKCCE